MSTVFTCPDAPTLKKIGPCPSPSEGVRCDPDFRCGYCEDGVQVEEVSDVPWVNTSIGADLCHLLGLPCTDHGTIPADDVLSVLRRIRRALDDEAARAHLVEPAYDGRAHEPRIKEDPETGLPVISTGCHVRYKGTTDARNIDRLERLRTLFVYAVERGYSVSWH